MTLDPEQAKKLVGEKAAEFVKDGMIVGLGTGSTAYYTINKLGEMVANGLNIKAIPTSKASEEQAIKVGIPLVTLDTHTVIDITIDGADEIDPDLNLIKGLGGALLREKIVACVSKQEIIIADERKIVKKLGTRSPLPVEIVPFGLEVCLSKLKPLCKDLALRMRDSEPFITDNGNYILDLSFDENGIENAVELEAILNNIPGVVENGLFIGLATSAIVESEGELKILKRPN